MLQRRQSRRATTISPSIGSLRSMRMLSRFRAMTENPASNCPADMSSNVHSGVRGAARNLRGRDALHGECKQSVRARMRATWRQFAPVTEIHEDVRGGNQICICRARPPFAGPPWPDCRRPSCQRLSQHRSGNVIAFDVPASGRRLSPISPVPQPRSTAFAKRRGGGGSHPATPARDSRACRQETCRTSGIVVKERLDEGAGRR